MGVATQEKSTFSQCVHLFSAYLRSPHFIAGCQLGVGLLLSSFFGFFRSISWPGWCMAPTLVVVGQLLLAQNATLGARLSASCMLVGPSWVGAVFAGIVGTIARTVENKAAYIVLLCILTIIAFAILSGPRAARAPHFIGYGILLSLVFVIPLVVGEFQYGRSIGEYWKNPVWDSIRSSMLAAGCVLVSGVLVFPSLAGSELQCTTAHVLRNVGRCMSSMSSTLFQPSIDTPATSHSKGAHDPLTDEAMWEASVLEALQKEEDMDFLLALEEALNAPLTSSRPLRRSASLSDLVRRTRDGLGSHLYSALSGSLSGRHAPKQEHHASKQEHHAPTKKKLKQDHKRTQKIKKITRPVPVATLRPQLQQTHLLLAGAAFEPPQLQLQRLDLKEWHAVVGALQLVITRVASMESLLHVGDMLTSLHDGRIRYLFQVDVIGSCRRACAVVAGACHNLADAILQPPKAPMAGCRLVVGTEWRQLHDALVKDMSSALERYWERFTQQQGAGDKPMLMAPIVEVRSMLYAGLICVGVLDAMDALEQAVVQAVVGKPRGSCPRSGKQSPCYAKTGYAVLHEGRAPEGHLKEGHPAAPVKKTLSTLFWYHCGWVVQCLKFALALEVFQHWWDLYVVRVPRVLRGGWPAVRSTMHDRMWQFWLKTWVIFSTVTCALLSLQAIDGLRPWTLQYMFIAVVIAWDQKVESTVNKAMWRLIGTWFGASLGFAVMVNDNLATNPYGLAALVTVFGFVFGHFAPYPFLRVAIVMTVSAFNAPILCQYDGVSAGKTRFYVAIIVNYTIGATVTVLFNQLVLPWYTSSACRAMLASSLQQAGSFLTDMYTRFYYEGRKAATASGTCLSAIVPPATIPPHGSMTPRGSMHSRPSQPFVVVQDKEDASPTSSDAVSNIAIDSPPTEKGHAAGTQQGVEKQQAAAGQGAAQQAPMGPPRKPSVRFADLEVVEKTIQHATDDNNNQDLTMMGHPARLHAPLSSNNGGNGMQSSNGLESSYIVLAEEELEDTQPWHAKAVQRLQTQLAGPLVAVQISLMKETTLWKRGVLAMPRVVPDLLRQQLIAIDDLAGLEITLAYGPTTTGRFTGTAIPIFGLFLDKMVTALRLCRALVDDTAALLLRYTPDLQLKVQHRMAELTAARVQARECYLQCRRHLHVLMMDTQSPEERCKIMNTDDAIRMQTFTWAFITGVNQVQICCNVALHHCKETQPLVIPFL